MWHFIDQKNNVLNHFTMNVKNVEALGSKVFLVKITSLCLRPTFDNETENNFLYSLYFNPGPLFIH